MKYEVKIRAPFTGGLSTNGFFREKIRADRVKTKKSFVFFFDGEQVVLAVNASDLISFRKESAGDD